MKYEEIRKRLSRCQVTLELLQSKETAGNTNSSIKDTKQAIKVLKERIDKDKKLLIEAEGSYLLTPKGGKTTLAKLSDDELDALKSSNDVDKIKTAAGEEVKENSLFKKNNGVEFDQNETKKIAKEVGKSLAIALKKGGDELESMKAHHIEPNSFDIHVEYKAEGNMDEFSFYIIDDTLHLVDFSFDKELVEVGVKPSGEAIINRDVLANELLKHFKSLKEEKVNEVNYDHYTTPKHFDICPGAEALRDEVLASGKTPEELGEWTFKHDELFKLEKAVLKANKADERHVKVADKLRDEIIHLSRDLGIEAGKIHYLKGHVKKIEDVAAGKEVNEGEGDDHHYLKVPNRDYKKAMSILDQNVDPTYVKTEVVDDDGAGNVIIYFVFRHEYGFDDMYDDPEGKENPEFYQEPDEDPSAFMYDVVMDLRANDIAVVDSSAELDENAEDGGDYISGYDDGEGPAVDDEGDSRDHMGEGEDLDIGHQDDEPSMLKSSAFETATYAAKLAKKLAQYDQVDGEVDFPNWWQKKLILARDYMSAAYHYLDSEEKQPLIDKLALEEGRSFKVKMYGPGMRSKGSDDVVQMIAKKLKIDRGNSAKDSAKFDKIERQVKKQYDANKREINFTVNLNESVNEGTELYDRNGINIKRFAGGQRGLMVQITYGGDYIHVPAEEFETLARAMQSVQGDLKDMSTQYPRRKNIDEIKAAKIQKAHGQVVAKMKELAKQYKAGDKSVVSQLKDLTAKKKELEKHLDQAVAGTHQGQELTELTADQRNELVELQNILDDVNQKGDEAREIIRQSFPRMLSKGDAYGAFEFGSSANRYDTTLESIIEEIEEYYDEEEDDMDEGEHQGSNYKWPMSKATKDRKEADKFAGSDPKAGSTIKGTGFDWKKKPLKEFTDRSFKGSELIDDANKRGPDMFGKQIFADLLPKGVASENDAFEALKKHDKSGIKQRMGQYAPMFVHVQYHELEHEGDHYRMHQTQYYNSNFEDKDPDFNPRVSKITLFKITKKAADRRDKEETDNLGTILVKTGEYVQDLRNLPGLGKRHMEEGSGGQIIPGDYVKNQHGNIYQRVDGKVGRHDAYVRVINGKSGKKKTGLHDSFKLTLVNKDELKENVKVGDTLTKDGKKGKVTKISDTQATVDFGNGDVYGIAHSRIKDGKILKEATRQDLGMSSSVSKRRAKAELKKPGNDGSKVYGLDKDGKRVHIKNINDVDKFKKFELDADLNEVIKEEATCCGKCGRVHVKGSGCKRPYLKGSKHCRTK